MRVLSNAQYDALLTKAASVDHLQLHVERLMAEVKELAKQVDVERARANRAVDAQLAVRGFPTVTPPTSIPDFPDVLDEDPEAVAKVEARMSQGDATVFAERF
jgi:hypothetical protein